MDGGGQKKQFNFPKKEELIEQIKDLDDDIEHVSLNLIKCDFNATEKDVQKTFPDFNFVKIKNYNPGSFEVVFEMKIDAINFIREQFDKRILARRFFIKLGRQHKQVLEDWACIGHVPKKFINQQHKNFQKNNQNQDQKPGFSKNEQNTQEQQKKDNEPKQNESQITKQQKAPQEKEFAKKSFPVTIPEKKKDYKKDYQKGENGEKPERKQYEKPKGTYDKKFDKPYEKTGKPYEKTDRTGKPYVKPAQGAQKTETKKVFKAQKAQKPSITEQNKPKKNNDKADGQINTGKTEQKKVEADDEWITVKKGKKK